MSVSLHVPWVRVDGRIYVDAMALEVLLRDFVEQLENEHDPDGAEAIGRLADALGHVSAGGNGRIHV